jgi:hypothetical protein
MIRFKQPLRRLAFGGLARHLQNFWLPWHGSLSAISTVHVQPLSGVTHLGARAERSGAGGSKRVSRRA